MYIIARFFNWSAGSNDKLHSVCQFADRHAEDGAYISRSGKKLTIEAKDQSDKNVYVKKVTLNGKTIKESYLTYAQLAQGGKIVFYMDDKPDK